jgi:hypothetical protein
VKTDGFKDNVFSGIDAGTNAVIIFSVPLAAAAGPGEA